MARLAGSSKLLRAMNESATLGLLLEKGTLTRAELREITGLSKPTTSDVLRTLTDAGLAMVTGHTRGGPGPNAEIYAVNPAAAHVVAISVRDVTETAHSPLAAALCDLTGAILARGEYSEDGLPFDEHRPSAAEAEPETAVRNVLADLCEHAGLAPEQVTHLQLGVPGSYDPRTDTIRHIDVTSWGRAGLVSELAIKLDTSCSAENDVNLAAIAERHRGVGAGTDGFGLLWFGAGLGCAIDLGDTLLRGATGGAGEIGYVPYGPRGNGRPTDLQEVAGGPALLALAERHGIAATTPEQAVSIAAGSPDDAEAIAFLRDTAERIGVALASVAAILDPPLIVLAGEIAQAGGGVLRDLVVEAFHRDTPLRTPVEVTSLTDDAVLLGAVDAGLRIVRESLIDSLRFALIPA